VLVLLLLIIHSKPLSFFLLCPSYPPPYPPPFDE
jgi:hypothetical protein